jgi:DNA-binding SARP family transcriptional activator
MEFRILGPLEVWEGGQPIPLGGIKQRAVLAILLLHANDLLSADRIIDELWGETPPDTARNVIQVYMSQLRKVLEPGVPSASATLLVTRQPGYLLNISGEDLDLTRAEHLVDRGRRSLEEHEPVAASRSFSEALALWRGDALGDFRLEQFAQAELERIEEFHLSTREDWFEAELEVGHGSQLVPELQAAIAAYPLRERLRAHLMLALYQSGRQAEALDAYRAAAELLGEELGLDPGPALTSLHEAILRQDPSLTPTAVVRPADVRVLEDPNPYERTSITAMVVRPSTGPDDPTGTDRLAALLIGARADLIEETRDRVVAVFGFPYVQDDVAERAVLLGKLIADGDTSAPAVGLASARLSVAELEDDAAETVIDRATQLAAVPGGVVVDNETRRRIEAQFPLTPTLSGWLVETTTSSRRQPDAPTSPLVGRDREMESLGGVIDDLTSGRGRVLLIDGDTGLGKTRMLWELSDLAGARVRWLQASCGSPGNVGPFPVITQAVRGWLGLDVSADPTEVRRHLEAAMTASTSASAVDDASQALQALLAPDDGRLERLDGDALIAALRLILTPDDHDPSVIAIDDVHEIDADSRYVLEGILSLTDDAPVCVVLAARSDASGDAQELLARADSAYRHRLARIKLEPLSEEASAELAEALSPSGILGPSTRADLVARSEGNPLYLEQLVGALGQSGGLERAQGWTLALTHAGTLLPTALEDLLAARIHQLPQGARSVAQAAAVIGDPAVLSMLLAVTEMPEATDAISQLLRAEVLVEAGRIPELSYRFRHGLLRDATLTTLTPARAREMNARAAVVLEQGDSADPEMIAYYRYRAGQWEEALIQLRSAAARAEPVTPANAARLWVLAARAAERTGDEKVAAELQERAAGLLSTHRGKAWRPSTPSYLSGSD